LKRKNNWREEKTKEEAMRMKEKKGRNELWYKEGKTFVNHCERKECVMVRK
jgi:hypothetical protein